MQSASHAGRHYAIVTAAYWGFTLSDGALRMLVLLHFFRLGFSPFTLAFLFLLYELAGIVANLGGGWLAARFGITRMLAVGLALQIAGLLLLALLDPGWGMAASVAWVITAQGVSGVAKDLTKTASKSAIKLVAAEGAGQLFRWVAWFTGSKNAMKGAGFFAGGLLLDAVGFRAALWIMAALLGVVLAGVLLALPADVRARDGLAQLQGTVRQEPGREPARRRPHWPVRRARRVVRGRPAGVPLRPGLALHRGRRVPGAVDHRLRRHPGRRPVTGGAQRGRAEPRGAGRPAVVRRARPGAAGARPVPGDAGRAGGPTWWWSRGSACSAWPSR